MKNIFLATIIGLAMITASKQLMCSSASQENIGNKKASWLEVVQPFATNLISGGLIGALTGKISSYAVTRLLAPKYKDIEALNSILVIIIWITEIQSRVVLVKELNSRLEEQSIPHNPTLITGSAWVASWLAWL